MERPELKSERFATAAYWMPPDSVFLAESEGVVRKTGNRVERLHLGAGARSTFLAREHLLFRSVGEDTWSLSIRALKPTGTPMLGPERYVGRTATFEPIAACENATHGAMIFPARSQRETKDEVVIVSPTRTAQWTIRKTPRFLMRGSGYVAPLTCTHEGASITHVDIETDRAVVREIRCTVDGCRERDVGIPLAGRTVFAGAAVPLREQTLVVGLERSDSGAHVPFFRVGPIEELPKIEDRPLLEASLSLRLSGLIVHATEAGAIVLLMEGNRYVSNPPGPGPQTVYALRMDADGNPGKIERLE